MNRIGTKFVSILLSLTLLFTGIIPQTSFAATTEEVQAQPGNGAEPELSRKKEVKQLYELQQLRDRHTKHYLNDDGSRTAEVSSESLHYKDSEGKWKDISNKLIPSENPDFALRNEANSFKVHYAPNTNSPTLVSLRDGQGYTLSWNLVNPNTSSMENGENSVIYRDIYFGVDIEYKQLADGIKEDIILKTPETSNNFIFNIKTGGLTPLLHDDNSIGFYSDPKGEEPGEMKFLIPRPYMIDSNHQQSQDVVFQLRETGLQDEYELTVIADYNWLSDPARTYPVKIDPIVTSYVTSNVLTDTYIVEGQPYQYYNSSYMTVGYDSVLDGRTRALVKMDEPSLPEGAIVTDAYFRMYKYTATSYDNDMIIARITEDWNPIALTWDNKPSIDDTYEKTPVYVTNVKGDHTGWVDFNVWSIVKGWYGDEFSNYGFMVMNNNEGNPLSFFYASEYGANAPNMRFTYITDPLGLNPYWGYANTPWGSVNTMSGNFLSSSMDYSLPGRGIPIAVSRTYNSRGDLSGIFGNNWFSNIDMQIRYHTWGYVLVDSSGAERPFLLASDGQTFIAPTNYPMQLYKNGDGTFTVQEAYTNPGIINKVEYQIKDELPSATFNFGGKLASLTDGKGNTTTLTWNASSVVITDSSGREVTINLDENGRAANIQDMDGIQKVVYSYDGSNLTGATYKDAISGDKTVSYEWHDGVIIKAIDKNGTPIHLKYNNNQIVSIGAVNMLGNPSFEAEGTDSLDPYLWTPVVDQDNGSVTLDDTYSVYGNKSLKIESMHQDGTSGMSYLYANQLIRVEPNTDYILTSSIKTENLAGKAFLQVRQLDASMNSISDPYVEWISNRPGITGTNAWQNSELQFTTSTDAAYLVVYAEVEHDVNTFGGIAYFDGIQLEEGTQKSKFHGHTVFRNYTESDTPTAMVTSPSGEMVKYQNNKWGNPILIMNDVQGEQAKTIMSWDTSDRLRTLITPEHAKDGGDGKGYTYEYDIVGNMTKATDPLDRETSFNYYYNHLQQTTLPDNESVATTWDPVNLTGVTSIDQSLNSKAYRYNTYGNLIQESNILGVADNRVLNSNFETGFDSIAASDFTRSSSAYTLDGILVGNDEPRFADGKFGQALTVEKGTTNLIDTQGGGASTDWTKWTHWGKRSYWSSETQTEDPNFGMVYEGVNANSTETFLYDYHPYSVTSGQPYTISMYLKASDNWSDNTLAYMTNPDWTFFAGTNQNISLTESWQKYTWTITPDQSQSTIGIGIRFDNLPAGVILYASRPQLEALPYATSYADTSRSGEMLTLPSGLFSATQGTIEAWVKPLRDYDSSTSYSIQMITDVAGTGQNGLLLAIDENGKFYTQAGTGSGVVKAISSTTAQKDNWYHVAGRWDGSGISIFVNGVKEATTPGSLSISLSQTPAVGRQSSTAIRYFDGLIDDLRISNIARTDTAIADAYNLMQPSGADSSTTYKLNFDDSIRPVYQPTGWSKSNPIGRINHAEYDPTTPYGGSNVLHINSGTSANASQVTDYIPLTGTSDFIVSGDIKVNKFGGPTETDGVRLQVNWYDSGYNEIEQDRLFALNQSQDWKNHSMVVSPPGNAVYAKVAAIAYKGFDAHFDNIQFEKSSQVRDYNMLENSSFERDMLKWSSTDSSVNITTGEAYSGGKSIKIEHTSSTGNSWAESQTVIPVKKGQTYTISALIKTDFDTIGTGGGAFFHYYYYDEEENYLSDKPSKLINKDTDWTKYVEILTADSDGFIKLRGAELYHASGKVYFDNIRFSPGNYQSEYTYDSDDNYVEKIKNQLGQEINYVNDSYGQVTQVTTPTGEVTDYTCDGQGALQTVEDNAGNVATYTMDNNGNVTNVIIEENGLTPVYESSFEYDEYGNMVKEIAKPDLGDSGQDIATEYIYDESGRLTGKINPGSDDSAASPSISLDYGFFGLKDLKIKDGSRYSFAYDLEGRTTKEELFDSSDTKTKEFAFTYDGMGRLKTLTEKDGSGTEISKIEKPTGEAMYDETDKLKGFDLVYEEQTSYPVTYLFDYLVNGLVKTVQAAGEEFKFIFSEGGQLTAKDNPNNTQDEFKYNTAGQVIESKTNSVIESINGSNTTTSVTPKWSSKYEYDADGRIVKISGEGAGSPNAEYAYNNGTEELNRLTQAVIDDGTNEYTFDYAYDSRGNILEMDILDGTVQQQTFTYNDDNQIINTGFVYDDNGNLTEAVIKGQTYYYFYDKTNRLIEVQNSAQETIA